MIDSEGANGDCAVPPLSGEQAETLGELQATISELRAAVQARDEFISMVVHEIRNPLTPLLMQATSLLHWTQDIGPNAERIERGVRMLNHIVENLLRRTTILLDASRMSSGLYRLELAEVDGSEVIRGVATRMTLEASAAGSSLQTQIPAGIVGHWDALALEQIADNLISNAIKYGAGRDVHVALSARDGRASLSVTDHGMGISAENLARVFDRFERAVSHGGQASGFGVGLWLVGRLVHEMGGAIDINSSGEGTTFVVGLPMAAKDEGA